MNHIQELQRKEKKNTIILLAMLVAVVAVGVACLFVGTSNMSFREALDHSTPHYPIVFDYSGLEKELAAVQKVINLYFPNLITTKEIRDDPTTKEKDPVPVMNEAGYAQMLQAFKAAGSDKIVAELQKQLDAWLAENPDW